MATCLNELHVVQPQSMDISGMTVVAATISREFAEDVFGRTRRSLGNGITTKF